MARKPIMTPVAFLSFPHVDLPQQPPIDKKTGKPQGEAKYSVALVWPEGTDLTELQNEVVTVAVERFGPGAVAKLKSGALKNPLRSSADDVAEKKYPKGSTFTNARSAMKPQGAFPWKEPGKDTAAIVPDDRMKDVFYPGAKVRATLTAFAYDTAGNRGVSFGLGNLQLIDGTTPRWAGRADAVDEFAPLMESQPAPLAANEAGPLEGEADADA